MLIPAEKSLMALSRAIQGLAGSDDANLPGSFSHSVQLTLKALMRREKGGVVQLQRQFANLAAVIGKLREFLPEQHPLVAALSALADRAATAALNSDIGQLESDWRQLLADFEGSLTTLSRSPVPQLDRFSELLMDWEAGDLEGQVNVDDEGENALEDDLTMPLLTSYIRDYLNDDGAIVSNFQPLAGGFGKQTYLFDVESTSLNASLVMRRDRTDPTFDNDCHRIHKEYRLLEAVYARGFPTPEMLWLDTEHKLLPGGHFLVMRRVPGASGGSVFAASGEIPQGLSETLAQILARLHAMPIPEELADLTDSINAERRQLSRAECVRRYLQDWLSLYLNEPHIASPALVGQFHWLLEHMPIIHGEPVLLHGDIGFHNFLFDQGQLTAVLDWEFAHLGDPAEDLAYVRNTLGDRLDWEAFLDAYCTAGGLPVDEARVRYFQVWGHVRNAAASGLITSKLAEGRAYDLNLMCLPYENVPMFLREANRLITLFHADGFA